MIYWNDATEFTYAAAAVATKTSFNDASYVIITPWCTHAEWGVNYEPQRSSAH